MKGLQFLVIDTETTGLDHAKDQVVEVGAVLMGEICGPLRRGSVIVDPGIPIPSAASAIHHLVDEDVRGALSLAEGISYLFAVYLQMGGQESAIDAYVAHNAPFDRGFVQKYLPKKPWIDTKRLAQRVLPDLASHSNQFLRYELKLSVPKASGLSAHRALADAEVTSALLLYLLNGPAKYQFEAMSLEEFCAWIDSPILGTVVKFGKHKGLEWKDVPWSYLDWLSREGKDLDEDTKFTVHYWLNAKRR